MGFFNRKKQENKIVERQVDDKYLQLRQNVLDYTNADMNLTLEADNQVYIAVFDIPAESGIVEFHTQTLALVFGLNTHLYHGSGMTKTGLEEDPDIMQAQAMQSVLISSGQALSAMELVDDTSYYESDNVRAYLKTRKGTYFKELIPGGKVDNFLLAMMSHVMSEIADKMDLKYYGFKEINEEL